MLLLPSVLMALCARDNQGSPACLARIQARHPGRGQRTGHEGHREGGPQQLRPAGGATAQLHRPHVTSWLFCFGFLPLCPFSLCQNDFPLLVRFLAFLSSFPLSSLHQLWTVSYVPGVDPGTTLVASIEALWGLCCLGCWHGGHLGISYTCGFQELWRWLTR